LSQHVTNAPVSKPKSVAHICFYYLLDIVIIIESYINHDTSQKRKKKTCVSLILPPPSGSVVASAFEDTQGYQIINTTQPSGLYTVRICIVRQTPSQSFDMGFAVSQRVANTGWLQ